MQIHQKRTTLQEVAMALSKKVLFLVTLLLIDANLSAAQTQRCTNGYTCVGPQQFNYCGEGAEGMEDGPFKCTRVGGDQTICFGGEVGYGAATDESGPCLKKPTCSQAGSFGIATGKEKIPELCSAYYTCAPSASGQFRVTPQVCEPNYEFSTATGKCEPTAIAGCSQIRITTTTTTTAATTTAASRSPATKAPIVIKPKEPTDYPDYYEYPDPGSTAKPQKPTVVCQNQKSGRMTDPASCRFYYRCGLMGPRRIKCPARNLYYNEKLKMCWFKADCGNREV